VPTLWIVLGPLGQSITAAHALGTATTVLPAPYGTACEAMRLVYGAPICGFAMLWLALVIAVTIHTAHEGMPFSLTWWPFTFPVGTIITGTSGLAAATGSHFIAVAVVGFYIGLLVAWGTVAVRTGHGTFHGHLLRTPPPDQARHGHSNADTAVGRLCLERRAARGMPGELPQEHARRESAATRPSLATLRQLGCRRRTGSEGIYFRGSYQGPSLFMPGRGRVSPSS